MRLATFEAGSDEQWGRVGSDGIATLETFPEAPESLLHLIQESPVQQRRWLGLLEGAATTISLSDVALAAPIPRLPVEILAVGVNYQSHLDETQVATGVGLRPHGPIVFAKAATSVVGPRRPILVDRRLSAQVDWEVELAVVIGRGGKDIPASEALEHVFGYTIANDVSARDVQFSEGGQWYRGKSFDSFCPLGPWIVTADEFSDHLDLIVSLRVNGIEKQRASTADLIFGVQEIVEYLSRNRTLIPGTVILTGTPGGVGFSRTPAEFLQPGDEVEVEIEGIGIMSNPVRDQRWERSADGARLD